MPFPAFDFYVDPYVAYAIQVSLFDLRVWPFPFQSPSLVLTLFCPHSIALLPVIVRGELILLIDYHLFVSLRFHQIALMLANS